jgi:hypothetical protein
MSTGRTNQAKGEAERRAVADWYRKAGLFVVNFSRPGVAAGKRGKRGTMTTPGWPDLVVFDRRDIEVNAGRPLAWTISEAYGWPWLRGVFAHEAKAGRARPTREQREMRIRLEACGIHVLIGGVEVAKAELRRRRLLIPSPAGEILRPVGVTRTDAPAPFTHTEVAG